MIQQTSRFSLAWLTIGLFSLAISGLFSIVLAIAWHPSFKQYELFTTLFHRALVVHVNLSISVWFLCCLFALWSGDRPSMRLPYFEWTSRALMILGIILMTVASLDPAAVALMSNYVPVLQHPLFYLSLGCITAATLIQMLKYDTPYPRGLQWNKKFDFISTSNHLSRLIVGVALVACAASGRALDAEITGELYYELLFWGTGHVLQFLWVQVMLVAWALMLTRLNPSYSLIRGFRIVLWANLLCVMTTPIPYLLYHPASGDFRLLMTQLMAWVSGLAPILFIALYVVQSLRKKQPLWVRYNSPVGACFYWSLILFALGGAFALMIDGINVKIPAHYHGSLLGVTIALMGLTYLLFTEHGFTFVERSRMARWQPAILGIGQVMHIIGLFWSGGYGVQRKSPDAVSDAMTQADLALRVQSSGGGIAIIGGLLFLIVLLRAWRKKPAV
jgi:cytochrome c oxidase subunit I